MLKSLRLQMLIGVLGIIFLTNFSIIFLVQDATEKVLYTAQMENAHNIIKTVHINVENEYKSILFFKEDALAQRKSELKNITLIALSHIEISYNAYKKGILSEREAKDQSIEAIKQLRYDNGIGYFWINDTGQPFPRMIMHPTIPELDGNILDDPSFNQALGIDKNLFAAFVDACLDSGEGYVDYLWPKPTPEGLTEEQPKISYVHLFEEWNWIIGTGVYIDKIEEDVERRITAVLEELKDTVSRITIAENGYMYIFNGDGIFLIHPSQQGTDGRSNLNPATGNPIMDELVLSSKTPEIPFEYIWDKPQHEGEFKYEKMAYISYFEPLDWYIASSIYKDEIVQPARVVRRKIMLMSIFFILIALLLSLLLSQNLTKPLRKLMLASQDIAKEGTLDGKIPVSGTMETKELGIILGNMIQSMKRTGDQLRQAQKMETVGTLAGGLAHDFNNMLGGIIGTLSLIENTLETQGSIEKEKLEEYMTIMHECSLKSASMVQELLSLSRKQELNLAQVDLNTIIRHVMKIAENSFDKSVKLAPLYKEDPAFVKADATQIEQALLNFCINAEHAMTLMRSKEEKWGGILTVSLDEMATDSYFCQIHPEAQVGLYYVLSVKDTGVGMDMVTVAKIFNPFFTTKKKGQGSGLGLSMVYNIIKQHEGFIDVYSEPGVGSNLKIYLPVLRPDQIKELKGFATKRLPPGVGLILVVDDEKTMRKTASEILTTNGYRILLAKDGLEGLNMFRRHHEEISAVLLDMAMPKMSGKEAFIGMKDIDPDIKVVLTSGFRHDERVEDLMRMGVKIFLQKPYTYAKLIEVFHQLFKNNTE